MADLARFVNLTRADGSTMPGILVPASADTGEGESKAIVIPFDRLPAGIEATQGADADSYVEA